MKKYFAYTRVSTVKQGVKGVSLVEQKSAIEFHAQRHGLEIVEWFEETVTAAKTGRAIFTNIMKRLRKGEADGLIIHKIDRSARNLKDWAALGELIDAGIDVQVSAENYDLSSRGGRLSADIQAVIAADYIRNLREECLKGMRGRLKLGIYPLKAPVGYQDNGGGELKTIDPVYGPLVKMAFELYATNNYGLITLGKEMYRSGLRSNAGGNLGKNGFSRILNNPFYYGKIFIRTTGETYKGKHEPLITKELFNRVQAVLTGKARKNPQKRLFAFQRTFKCQTCQYSLIAERQKGHVYYRCHTTSCAMKSIREDKLVDEIDRVLKGVQFTDNLVTALCHGLELAKSKADQIERSQTEAIELQLANAKTRLERLMDLFIDGKITKSAFDKKQEALQESVVKLEDQLINPTAHIGQVMTRVAQFLEQAKSLILGYKTTPNDFRGDLLKSITSNPTISPKNVDIPVDLPWSLFINGTGVPLSAPHRDIPRTKKLSKKEMDAWAKSTINELIKYFSDPATQDFQTNISNRYIPPPTKPH